MRLIWATEEFFVNSIPFEGFPILLDKNMRCIRPVLLFLIYECLHRGRVESKCSWRVYGQSLYDYFGFLEDKDLSWQFNFFDSNHSVIAAYRDWALDVSNNTANTVNQRLRVIVRFYQYALKVGWIKTLPFEFEEFTIPKSRAFLAHIHKTRIKKQSPDVMLKHRPGLLKVLSIDEVTCLLEGTACNITLNNIVRLELQTGLRKSEALTFPRKYVVNPFNYSKIPKYIRINLDPQDMLLKGGRPRTIDVPFGLMERLWDYILHERNHRLIGNSIEEPEALFINRCGVPYSVNSQSINTQIKNVLGYAYQHMLRHTYATHTMCALKNEHGGKSDYALMYIRDRLGHVSVTTTEKYLHYVESLEDELMSSYQQEIDSI